MTTNQANQSQSRALSEHRTLEVGFRFMHNLQHEENDWKR